MRWKGGVNVKKATRERLLEDLERHGVAVCTLDGQRIDPKGTRVWENEAGVVIVDWRGVTKRPARKKPGGKTEVELRGTGY